MNAAQTAVIPSAEPAAPSLVRQILLDIWSTTLKHDVTVHDNFFQSGGDSLTALVTIEQINQRLGWRLNLGDLMRFQTIAELSAEKAQPQAANSEIALIRMSNQGSRTPIVFVHAGHGMVDGYGRLIRELGTDRACYGLQSPLLVEGAGSVPDDIQGLAGLYADALQDEFGEDEFHLFGSCAGGALSLELNRIAADRGLAIGRTIVVDGYIERNPSSVTSEDELIVDFYEGLLRMSGTTEQFPAMSPRDADLELALRNSAAAMFGAGLGFDERAEAFCRRLYTSFVSTARAWESYRPEPADVDLLLFLAQDNYTLEDWRSVIKGELTAEVLDSEFYGQRLCIEEASYLVARTINYLGED
ncbi:phosphopantetheine-binding protein [Streptomyces sp. NBC_01433]|uniref:thioesterase domain-containing protein n=1 Tax=Streptomyces sp. NBC_01433 TaxID=2903864 RepID=UPI00224CDDB1|nr:alpha/beta fold hydrolase [Streptomyces sp. NBC_01433]MCX4675338.1 phosphopantetheine-binding protein [Streptomyces sp. NBC_01433]